MAKNRPDEQFNNRIKSMEKCISSKGFPTGDKKPKDLLRAIGKIESNDWNIRQIERKIEQSKKTEVGTSREKVPKWSKEQFLQRQTKISHPSADQEGSDDRFKDIDQTIRTLDKQLKEGSIRDLGERGKNKVASIAGNFIKNDKEPSEADKSIVKSSSKANLVFGATHGASDICHFCKKNVYLVEKLSAEGLILHRNCLKCHHCHTSLRVGGYAFDRNDPNGKFYCTQHFRLPAKNIKTVSKKTFTALNVDSVVFEENKNSNFSLEKLRNRQLCALDRGQTPERIEFENTDAMSDGEPSLEHIIDENEWTDRNFGTGTEDSDTDFSSSEDSDSVSNSDVYEEAMGSPLGAETLQLANEWIGKQRYASNQYSDDDEFYVSSEDDEADSQTDGEELDRARQERMQEVKLKPIPYLQTDTETECTPTTDFLNVDKNKNNKKCQFEKTEIKCIENKSDKKICTEIDKLNENLYNLNSYLQLSKDIDNLKKENLVKNDIQRKLSLKSEWLCTKYGRTGPLNSSNGDNNKNKKKKIKIDCNSGSRYKNLSVSEERFKTRNLSHAHAADCRVPRLSNSKSISNQSLCSIDGTKIKRTRLYNSFDDLRITLDPTVIISSLKISKQANNKNSLMKEVIENNNCAKEKKLNELKITIGRVKDGQAKYVVPKTSTDPAKRDLTRFFPPKNEIVRSSKVLTNPKDLKDIDLSKYFLPSPVQELKSISSPGNSPQLTRKILSRELNYSLPKLQKEAIKSQIDNNFKKPAPLLHEQHNDKINIEPEKRLSDTIDEIAGNSSTRGGEYNQLVESIKSPTDNIDEMFEEVAAALIDVPVSSTKLPCQHSEYNFLNSGSLLTKSKFVLVPSAATFAAVPKWQSKPLRPCLADDDAILSKLSSNLLREIGKIEEHLQMNENIIEGNQYELCAEKDTDDAEDIVQHSNWSTNISVDSPRIEQVGEPIFPPVPPEFISSMHISQEKYARNDDENTFNIEKSIEKIKSSEDVDTYPESQNPLKTSSLEERILHESVQTNFGKRIQTNSNEKNSITNLDTNTAGELDTHKSTNMESTSLSRFPISTDFAVENRIQYEINEHDRNEIEMPKSTSISQKEQYFSIVAVDNQNHEKITINMDEKPFLIISKKPMDIQIPSEVLQKRQEFLLESFPPSETFAPISNISKIMNDECSVKKSLVSNPDKSSSTQELCNIGGNKNSTKLRLVDTKNSYTFSDAPNNSNLAGNDNIERAPSRPLRTKRKDATDLLIERSQLIHNKKQEFMKEKLFGNNPYLKRTLSLDIEDNVNRNRNNIGNDNCDQTIEIDKKQDSEQAIPKEDADELLLNENNKSRSLQSSNMTSSATTNLNVFDLFKRNGAKNKQTDNGKDGCIVS